MTEPVSSTPPAVLNNDQPNTDTLFRSDVGLYNQACDKLKRDIENRATPEQIKADLKAVKTASERCSEDCPPFNTNDHETLVKVEALTNVLSNDPSLERMVQDINTNIPIKPMDS